MTEARGTWMGVRFAITVLGLVVLCFLAMRTAPVARHVVAPYTSFVARSGAVALGLIEADVTTHDTIITSPNFSVAVLNVCNGLEVMVIYTAAVLAFPAALSSRIIGVLGGLILIYFINLVRIVALFLIGARVHTAFENVHYYYAQAFVIVAMVCVWLVWVAFFSSYGRTTRRALSA